MRFPVTVYPAAAACNLYLQAYKDWLGQQSVASNTQRAYHSRVKQFLLFREYANLSDNPLDDLNATNEAMSLYLAFLKQSKGQSRSINANVNALNNFCQFLGLQGTQLKRERCYFKPLRVLNAKEQNDILLAVKRQESARDKALALILFYTGLRVGDCARLNVQDFMVVDQAIELANKSIRQNTIACLCLQEKSSGHTIKIPLNDQTALAIKQWIKDREKFVKSASESGLWLTKDGGRLSISGITFIIKRIGWQAHIEISAEILRRTWLSTASDRFNKNELATKFGDYISEVTIKRYGVQL